MDCVAVNVNYYIGCLCFMGLGLIGMITAPAWAKKAVPYGLLVALTIFYIVVVLFVMSQSTYIPVGGGIPPECVNNLIIE